MIIDFNDPSVKMKVDLTKVDQGLFRLIIEKVVLDERKGSLSSKSESFLTKDQLSLFINYINEVTHDHI